MKESRSKGIYILPNLFTTASLFSGFLGMLWAIEGQFVLCAIAILISCLCDGLDGKIARLTRANSEFGIQLDSLADLVSFGVTPALMIYLWQTHHFGRLGLVSSFFFIACGALRLARFNVQAMHSVQKSKKFFIGMPIPAAACILASLVLFSTYSHQALISDFFPSFALALIYLLSFLMISRVRYTAFKDIEMIKAHPFTVSVAIVLLFVLIASEPKLFAFIFFMGYLISGLVYTFCILSIRPGSFLRGLFRQRPS